MEKPRIALFVFNNKQARSLLQTNLFSSTLKDYKLIIFTSDSKWITDEYRKINGVVINTFRYPKWIQRSGTLYATALLWSNRKIGGAHHLRAISSFGNHKSRLSIKGMVVYNMEGWNNFKRFFVRFLGSHRTILSLIEIRHLLVRRYLVHLFLSLGIDSAHFSSAIVPFSGLLSPEFDDVVSALDFLQIKSIGFQENWDNLSSKTFIRSFPDYFCVWGLQSVGHLRKIHGNRKSEAVIVGSSRFSPYFFPEEKFATNVLSQLGLENDKYVLITGTGDGLDDYTLITETHSSLSRLVDCRLKIVYRPHPFTRNPIQEHLLQSLVSRGLVLDNRVGASNVYHHCQLVANASLVINQFSTVTLEALAANVKVLLPTFIRRQVNYDWFDALLEWDHLNGILLLPNTYLVKSQEQYADALSTALQAPVLNSAEKIDWFCQRVKSHLKIRDLLVSLENNRDKVKQA